MARRGKGEGSIYRRADGRWTARVTVVGGRRKDFYGKTRADVAQKLAAALKAQQDGLLVSTSGKLTLGQLLTQFLETKRDRIRESTYVSYEVQVRRHVVPHLGNFRVAQLTPLQLESFYRQQLGLGLSPRSVQYQHKLLHMALEMGVRWGLIARNVVKLVDPPRVESKRLSAFTIEQARSFLDNIAHERLKALYVITLCCGLRRGEVLALHWSDVNLNQGTLAVRHQYSKTRGGWKLAEPKTANSRRVVRLPQVAIEALRDQRRRQLEERLRAGPTWPDSDLVFTTTVGTIIDGNNLRKEFQTILARSGLPAMPFHALRHSSATLMLAAGVQPKVVAEMLGHSRVGVTLDVYSHVLPHLQEEAAAKIDALLG